LASAEEAASRLRSKLEHVLEPRMRLALVREWLLTSTPVDATEALIAVVNARVPPGTIQDPLREAALALLAPESEAGDEAALPYELRSEIYGEASRRGADELTRLMRTTDARESAEHPELRLPKELAEIPLGRRRSMAKGEDKNVLDGLARDPDRLVIENLLRNPRLREEDIVRVAALRPVAATTLEAVARSERWSRLPRVRVALARNPYSPVEVALKMMSTIPLPDLRAMTSDPDLHPETLDQARAELRRREPRDPGIASDESEEG